jgi:transitional endoplasmic reticulum ATPase
VRALDGAFLRHGRFDYVIPVGPPDPAAQEAIWNRYLAAIPYAELDMATIVEESRLFTPADIEFAARLASERVLFERGEEVATGDVLHAIGQTRRTLTRNSWPSSSRTSPTTPGSERGLARPRYPSPVAGTATLAATLG